MSKGGIPGGGRREDERCKMKEEKVSREKTDVDDRIVIEGSTSDYGRYGSEGLDPGRDPCWCVYTGGCHGNAPRRHDARTPLGACACQFQLDCCDLSDPVSFLVLPGLRVPLFLALNIPTVQLLWQVA